MAGEMQPPPAPCSRSPSTEDFCYVFLVELERGPSGLGMGLIDGTVSGPGLLPSDGVPFPRAGTPGPVVTGAAGRGPPWAWGLGLGGASLWTLGGRKGPRAGPTSPGLLSPRGACPELVGTVMVSGADMLMTGRASQQTAELGWPSLGCPCVGAAGP